MKTWAMAVALATGAALGCGGTGDGSTDGGSGASGSGTSGSSGSGTAGAGGSGTSGGGTGGTSTAGASGKAGTAGSAGAAGACKLVGPYSSKDLDCNACAEEKCCAEVNGCLGSVDCNDTYVNCILACSFGGSGGAPSQMACLDQCAKDSPKGKAEYDTAIGCADAKCAAVCQ